ncbi:MAG: hypothetical protein HS115_04010 [Spirochaetales bacterium]|nr:hypothetical protein [Spirochaetales bacterium]
MFQNYEKFSFDERLDISASSIMHYLLGQSTDLKDALTRSIYQNSLYLNFLVEQGMMPDFSEWVNGKVVDQHMGENS